jgi:pseudouridine kinase
MNRPRIVVVGAVAVDVKAKSFGALVRNADVPGRACINIGGVARNVAENLARLGAEVAIVSAVGDDEFGRLIRGDLSRAGVNLENLIVTRTGRTATWVGILDERGDLDVGVFGGEILESITPQAISERATWLAGADLIAVDATLPRATIDAIIALAKANHIPLHLNPASVARAQTIADCIGDFTIVTANALEAPVLTRQSIRGIDDAKRAARMLIERGVQRAIVTLGVEGIVYADAPETQHRPAHPTHVVDTTGAGDALAAMFLLCHLQGRALDETLERALRVAAMTVACEENASEEVGIHSPMETQMEPLELKEMERENPPDEIRDLAAFLYDLIENQITRGDTKAGLILAADTVFATAVSLLSKGTLVNLVTNSVPMANRLIAVLTILTFGALLCSTVFALQVARPILKGHSAGGTLFFFGRISQMSQQDFIDKFTNQSPAELRSSLLTEVHTTAQLASKKFLRIRYSLDFLIAAIFLWGMIQIVVALGN